MPRTTSSTSKRRASSGRRERRDGPRPAGTIGGAIYQWELAEWQPLMELVGELSGWFMWMGEIRLDDGTRLHAYKHRETRRYLHLAAGGDAYAYVPPPRIDSGADGYRPISRTEALEEAFFDWPSFHEGDADFAAELAMLAEARAAAERGEHVAYDHAWLARQRRFEAAVLAARRHEERNDPGFSVLRFDEGNAFFGDLDDTDDAADDLERRPAS